MSGVKSEHDDIHFEHIVFKQHFNEKIAVENALTSNFFFVKKKRKRNWFYQIEILVKKNGEYRSCLPAF